MDTILETQLKVLTLTEEEEEVVTCEHEECDEIEDQLRLCLVG